MKPLTLYVSDEVYSLYQTIALKQKTKAAALIRDAMTSYLEKLQKKKDKFLDKIVKKDYNNELEIIVEKIKKFEE